MKGEVTCIVTPLTSNGDQVGARIFHRYYGDSKWRCFFKSTIFQEMLTKMVHSSSPTWISEFPSPTPRKTYIFFFHFVLLQHSPQKKNPSPTWFPGDVSGKVARSLSAYDMQISDVTYGKAKRYVTQDGRLARNTRVFFITATSASASFQITVFFLFRTFLVMLHIIHAQVFFSGAKKMKKVGNYLRDTRGCSWQAM